MTINGIEVGGQIFSLDDTEDDEKIEQLQKTITEQQKTIEELQEQIKNLNIPVFNNIGYTTITDKVVSNHPNLGIDSVRALKQFGWVQLMIYGTMRFTKTTSTQEGWTLNDERFFGKSGSISSAAGTAYSTEEEWEICACRITEESQNIFKIVEQGVSGTYSVRFCILYPAANP